MTIQNQKTKDQFKEAFKKRLYTLVLKLVELIDSLDKRDRVCRIVGDQLLRSGTSILSNYIEAKSSSSKKEFIHYFSISLKSLNESKMWLVLLRDTKRVDRNKIIWFIDELTEIGNVLGSSILTMKGKK